MAFIAVVDILFDTQLFESEHTADTEQVFLLDAVFPVATIERVGNAAVKLRVHFVVRIEQVERDAAHVGTPQRSMNGEVGVGNINHHLVAVRVGYALNGQTVEVLRFVVGNLLTVHREGLGKVTVTVKETYGHHVDIAVRSLFQVVAGQDAQTAGVDFQYVAQAILHTEVSHRGTLGVGLHIHILAEVAIHLVHAGNGFGVLGKFLQAVVVNAAE